MKRAVLLLLTLVAVIGTKGEISLVRHIHDSSNDQRFGGDDFDGDQIAPYMPEDDMAIESDDAGDDDQITVDDADFDGDQIAVHMPIDDGDADLDDGAYSHAVTQVDAPGNGRYGNSYVGEITLALVTL